MEAKNEWERELRKETKAAKLVLTGDQRMMMKAMVEDEGGW